MNLCQRGRNPRIKKKMFKKILVPVDFSQASKIALQYASELLDEKGQLTLIHVFPSKIRETLTFFSTPEIVRDSEQRVEELRARAQQELEKIGKSYEEKGCNVRLIFNEGDPASSVINESLQGYDLVIVGIPEKKAQVASTALNIIKGVKTSCFVVMEHQAKPKFNKILFTADFSDISKIAFKEIALKLVSRLKCEVTVLNIFELYPLPYVEQGVIWMLGDVDEVKKNLQNRLVAEYPGEGVSYAVVEGADAGVEIVDFAEAGKYNIIVMAHEKKDWLERAFLGSVTTKVIKLSKLPVLIYKRSSKT